MLLHIPQLIDACQAAAMARRIDLSHDWVDGRATVGAQGAQVKCNQQLNDASPLRQELAQQLLDGITRHPLFFAAALPLKIMPPRFNRYAGGGNYGFHVDGSVMRQANGEQLRSDLSCTVFLNDPDSYAGGELTISDNYGEHSVKLAAGDAILYPASSLHCVTPVTSGARLAAFFWVQSMVRDDHQRRQLFEMDSAITRLTDTGADRDALVQLTGVYHNLLRQWADT